MNGKSGSRSPASRLRGLAFSRSVGGGRVRPKLRKALSVNSESEVFKTVNGGSREALDDLVMSKTPPLKRETCSSPVKVPSFTLRASSWKERDSRESPSCTEAETLNKQDGVNFEAQKGSCELDCKEFSSKIRDLIQQVLSSHLDNMEYNHEICGAKCKTISQMIENGVKSSFSAQYKIIALVYIGAIRDRGIEMASQSLWNPSTDSFVMATFDNNSLFATGIVFATLFNDE